MKNKLLRVDNLMFYVEDLEKSEKFYAEVLGMKKGWHDEEREMIGFSFPSADMDREKPDTEIVIHQDKTLPKMDYSFLVENVVKLCAEFMALGYKVEKEPFDVRCGKFAVLKDPDGNILPIIDLTKFGGKPEFD